MNKIYTILDYTATFATAISGAYLIMFIYEVVARVLEIKF